MRLSSEPANRQPRCTSRLKAFGCSIDQTNNSSSSKSTSAGHLMRRAPAGSTFLHLALLRSVWPSAACTTSPSHQMYTGLPVVLWRYRHRTSINLPTSDWSGTGPCAVGYGWRSATQSISPCISSSSRLRCAAAAICSGLSSVLSEERADACTVGVPRDLKVLRFNCGAGHSATRLSLLCRARSFEGRRPRSMRAFSSFITSFK
mmetsp:Transcript_34228/g.85294  ORF Transcript_34228/g.85294 Transcript_34228/m.85294 type:complete len:204 (-) Transcript_34228:2081-2692(-)